MADLMINLSGFLQGPMVLAFIVFLRVGAAMALVPGFGDQAVPPRVRLGLAIAFTLIVWPLAAENGVAGPRQFTAWLLLSETVAGLAMGIFFRLFVVVLQIAGMIAAQATSLSQIFGGATSPDPMPAFGNLLVVGGLALAMAAGLHVKIALALAQSYEVLPIGVLPSPSDLTSWGIAGISRAFAMAFSLAAPFVIASVVYNVALGAINRAMPQLMVAFVGAPAITLGGLVILMLTVPVILLIWLRAFDAGLASPFGANW